MDFKIFSTSEVVFLILTEFVEEEEDKFILVLDVKAFSDSTTFGIERKQEILGFSTEGVGDPAILLSQVELLEICFEVASEHPHNFLDLTIDFGNIFYFLIFRVSVLWGNPNTGFVILRLFLDSVNLKNPCRNRLSFAKKVNFVFIISFFIVSVLFLRLLELDFLFNILSKLWKREELLYLETVGLFHGYMLGIYVGEVSILKDWS